MTRQKIESDLDFLCQEAKKLGAANAVALKASGIVVDPRVSIKCRVPICAYYGNNFMCPPYVMSVSEFQETRSKYTHAILIQVEFILPNKMVQAICQEANFAELFKNKNYLQSLLPGWRKFEELIRKIEAISFNLGYRFAAGFGGGPCFLCDECVTKQSGEPCRHPFQARPSMEAVGIDVLKTAERAGFRPIAPTMEKSVGYGMVLVD